MTIEKNLRVAINFYKNLYLPVVRRNKKHLSKQILPISTTLQKIFLQLLLLEFCESFLLKQSKKVVVYPGKCKFSLDFQRREDQIATIYEKQIYFSICK